MPDQHATARAAAARIVATTEEIIAEVQKLPPVLITWVPAENVWTVMDNLCHIREFVPFWTAETLRIVRTPEQQWGRDHTDTNRLAAVTNTSRHKLDDVVADLAANASEASRALGALSDTELATEATSKNPRWALRPASFVVEHLLALHIEKHLGQIRRNVGQYAERQA